MALNKADTNSLSDNAVTTEKIEDGAITAGKLAAGDLSISKTLLLNAAPTITSLNTSIVLPSSGATITITGTGFVSIPDVRFLNTSTGARIQASTVGFTSSTTLTAAFPSGQTPGTYKVLVENPDGKGVISTSTITYSAAPTWSTAANLGSIEEGEAVNIQLLAYDDDSTAVSSYSLQAGSLPSGVTLSGDSSVGSLTGTAPAVDADTNFTFTIRATDDEGQTSDREFTLTITNWTVANSLRFDGASSDYLSRTFGASGNTKTFTFSFWVKKCEFATNPDTMSDAQMLFGGQQSGYPAFQCLFLHTNDTIFIKDAQGVSDIQLSIKTEMQFRDPSAWYHIVFAVDTTQATASNRAKLYVNGVLQTALDGEYASGGGSDTPLYPPQNTDLQFNSNEAHYINKYATNYEDMYMSEFVFIDGQQLTASSFGETDATSGIWKPKKVSGLTFGTNGFYLPFTNSASLGADSSGNSNDWTVNNLTAIDQTTDTPVNNFSTLNPLVTATAFTDNQTYSEGNTIFIPNSTDQIGTTFSTIGVQGSGKWYWEAQVVWNGTSNNANFPKTIGFCTENYAFNYSYLGQDQESWGMMFSDDTPDQWFASHPDENNNVGGTMANGDIVNLALDLDNGYFYFGVNGTYLNSGNPTSGASGTGAVFTLTATDLSKFIIPAISNSSVTTTYYKLNFGNPAFTISSGNSDANGYGNFEYAVPSGYFALNTKNLAEYG